MLDLKEGFRRLPLTKESKKVAIFSTPFGSYENYVLLFWLKTAPQKRQKLNTKYFGDIPVVFVYINDLVIVWIG